MNWSLSGSKSNVITIQVVYVQLRSKTLWVIPA